MTIEQRKMSIAIQETRIREQEAVLEHERLMLEVVKSERVEKRRIPPR